MAGEILTGGLSEPSLYYSRGFNPLEYVNVSHVIGMLELNVVLSYALFMSNKLYIKIFERAPFGSNPWVYHFATTLDATDGDNKELTIRREMNRAWLIGITPIENVVYKTTCSFSIKAFSNMSLAENYTETNKHKKLRICNNMTNIAEADSLPLGEIALMEYLTSSQNLQMSSSPGVLMQNGQYIFGQN